MTNFSSAQASGYGAQVEAKGRADSICLTSDGVVSLDIACPSSREALLGQGPAGASYKHRGIVVATDGSLKRRVAPWEQRSWAFAGTQCGDLWPALIYATGTLALEKCPVEEDLPIVTYNLSSMRLLHSMQRRGFPPAVPSQCAATAASCGEIIEQASSGSTHNVS